MTTKFYLHDAATGDTGTLPTATAAGTVSATTPTTSGSTIVNKSMDGTIGVLQKSAALTTLANQSAQAQPIARFLSAPIAAQTILAQSISVKLGVSTSNSASVFGAEISIAVWRPSSGALVGRLSDLNSFASSTATTSEANVNILTTVVAGNAQVIALDGDILVAELWRDSNAQTMSTAYTNTVFYDGTVEGSATDNAAYLLFTNDIAMFTAPTGFFPGAGPVAGMVPMMDMSCMMR